MSHQPEDVILRSPTVCAGVGVDRVTLWRWCRDGRFPKPVRIGPRASGWLKSEVDAWFKETAARRAGGSP